MDLEEQDELTPFAFELRDYNKEIYVAYLQEILGCPYASPNTSMKDLSILCDSGLSMSYRGMARLNRLFTVSVAACGGAEFAKLELESMSFPVKPLRWYFVQSPLEEINDEGIIRVSNPRSKRQVAIQKNGLVVINKPEFDLMDNESKAALKIHESVICAVNAMNPRLIEERGTAPIRAFVRALVAYGFSQGSSEGTPATAIRDAAEVLFPSPNKVDLDIDYRSKARDVNVRCAYSMFSAPWQKPNAYIHCETIDPPCDQIDLTLRIELTSEAPVIASRTMGYSRVIADAAIRVAQDGVRKNLTTLLAEWNRYVNQANATVYP